MIGTDLGGYVLERELGRGAMGVVYQARQVSLDRAVAVKVLHAHLSADEDFVERFHREARAIAQITHQNIVRILGVGEHEGAHFFAMELVPGETIKSRLNRKGRFDLKTAVRVMAQACSGVQAAHNAGIVHRDLKPENLALDAQRRLKVMDFGVARRQELDPTGGTHQGTLIGTPAFMSPEQAAGAPATPVSDVYALGVVFYEMLTGMLPFDHPDLLVLLQLHQWEEPPAPRDLVPELPVAIQEVVLKMLAKAPAERYAGCDAVIADLREVAAGRPDQSSACGTRTTGAVGLDLAGPAGPAPAPVADPRDPLEALIQLAYARLLRAARKQRVTLHLRNGGMLSGVAGHFAKDGALLSVPDVGDIALPVRLLASEPYSYGLDEAALRAQSTQWGIDFYERWMAEQTAPGTPNSEARMLADAERAFLVPEAAPPPAETRALADAWRTLCAERRDFTALSDGQGQERSGTVPMAAGSAYPDRLHLRAGKVVECRIEEERPSSLWAERSDGRRVRFPMAELECILRHVPTGEHPRPPADAHADRVTFHSGRVIACTILEYTKNALRVQKDDGGEARFFLREIAGATWATDTAAGPDRAADPRVQAAEGRVHEATVVYQQAVDALVAAVAPRLT